MKPDAETKKVISEAEHLLHMTKSEGWRIAKARLDELIVDLQMIGNVEGSTAQEKVTNMDARAMAAALLFGWLKSDIYGRIEQVEASKQHSHDDPDAFIARE